MGDLYMGVQKAAGLYGGNREYVFVFDSQGFGGREVKLQAKTSGGTAGSGPNGGDSVPDISEASVFGGGEVIGDQGGSRVGLGCVSYRLQ